MPFLSGFLRKCRRRKPRSGLASENTNTKVECVRRSVHVIHCGDESTDPQHTNVTGLPKDWQTAWEVVRDEHTSENVRNEIYRKMKKFPKSTMCKEMVIFRGGRKIALDREDTLRTLEKMSAKGEPEEFYDIRNKIGSGTFGDVYYARDRHTKLEVALKQCSPLHVDSAHYLYMNEMVALRVFKHPNVIECYASFYATPLEAKQDPSLRNVKVPFLVMELMECSLGELLDHVYKEDELDEDVIAYVMREILIGLAFLHKKGLFHRDIKSDNILLSLDGAVKVADFGLSTRFSCPEEEFHGMTGTTMWMAPEICRVEQPTAESDGAPKIARSTYTYKADIWSLGVVLIELLDGEPPYIDLYRAKKKSRIKENIVQEPACRPKRQTSPAITSIIDAMLCKDPSQRWDCGRLLCERIFKLAADKRTLAHHVQEMLDDYEREA